MLVKDRTGLTVEVELGQSKKKTIDWGDGGEMNFREDRTLSAHSEAIT